MEPFPILSLRFCNVLPPPERSTPRFNGFCILLSPEPQLELSHYCRLDNGYFILTVLKENTNSPINQVLGTRGQGLAIFFSLTPSPFPLPPVKGPPPGAGDAPSGTRRRSCPSPLGVGGALPIGCPQKAARP